MKNFKNEIVSKSVEIKNFIKMNKPVFLFGYNKIAIYFLQKKISSICVVDKKFIKILRKCNLKKDVEFRPIEEILPGSIFINCTTGVDTWKVNSKLSALGHVIFSWIQIKNAFDLRDFDYWYLVNFDKFFLKNISEFIKVYKILSDFQSKKEFLKILSYKVTGNEKSLKFDYNNRKIQYFPHFIYLNKDSLLVDVGAYDGDTIKKFLTLRKEYGRIIAFEPDKSNFKKLKNNFTNNKKISLCNKALSSQNKVMSFHSSNDTSRLDEKGNDKTIVNTLDSLGFVPDFIKVDIEGGERDFIIGSKETIKKYKPQLAICVYHKSDDFFYLVDLILSINNRYKIYFRHHSFGFTESVMYFI